MIYDSLISDGAFPPSLLDRRRPSMTLKVSSSDSTVLGESGNNSFKPPESPRVTISGVQISVNNTNEQSMGGGGGGGMRTSRSASVFAPGPPGQAQMPMPMPIQRPNALLHPGAGSRRPSHQVLARSRSNSKYQVSPLSSPSTHAASDPAPFTNQRQRNVN